MPIEEDAHFLWIPYYIHFNPLDLFAPEWRAGNVHNPQKGLEFLESYRWSSHPDYLGKKNFPSLTQRDFLIESFNNAGGYPNAIKEMLGDSGVSTLSPALTLE